MQERGQIVVASGGELQQTTTKPRRRQEDASFAANEESDDDDMPPPLEVVSRKVVRASAAESGTEHNEAAEELLTSSFAAPERRSSETIEARQKGEKTFASGLKKGFLNSSSSQRPTKAKPCNGISSDPVIVVNPMLSPAEASREALRLPELQEAMRTAPVDLSQGTSWVTPELVRAMKARPGLLEKMQDPDVAAAVQLMMKDPAQAKLRYQDNPTVTAFLKEFSDLMSRHFELLSQVDSSKPSGAPGPQSAEHSGPGRTCVARHTDLSNNTSSTAPRPSLSDPEVESALQDPEVLALLRKLQATEQVEMHEVAKDKPHLLHKLKALLDSGLLNMRNSPQ